MRVCVCVGVAGRVDYDNTNGNSLTVLPCGRPIIRETLLRESVCSCSQHFLLTTVGCSYNLFVFVGCLTSQQQASVSQGRICSDNFTCCHTEIEVADQTFYLTQSQYTDTGPTSPSTDPITPGAWQDSHWSANF